MTAAEKSGDVSVLRGTVVTCRDDPFLSDSAKAFTVETDGIVICRDGLIEAVGPAAELRQPKDPRVAEFLSPKIDLKNPRFKNLETKP